MSSPAVTVNGIAYRRPTRPVVVVCVDGGDPAYFDHARSAGIAPNIAAFEERGFGAIAESAMPSYTNPNNVSIITGAPPSVHGVSGNYFFDRATGAEVMMNDPEFVRCESVLAGFSQRGARVVAITAKDKLRRILAKGVDLKTSSIFSAERADECTQGEHGIDGVLALVGRPLPDIYSAELSLFTLEAGFRLLETAPPLLMYLSLTDYIQHKYAPGTPESDSFLAGLDDAVGRMAGLGAIVAVTADHGMSDKSRPDGSPNVVYLQDELDTTLGEGATKVVLPITDPYVVHHGSLGGFARVYCMGAPPPIAVMDVVQDLPGIAAVYDAATACAEFDLPLDGEGDVVVIADGATAVGSSEEAHDLSALEGHRLRSHGGLAERRVPFILSAPLNDQYAARADGPIRNYEIFDYAINGVAAVR